VRHYRYSAPELFEEGVIATAMSDVFSFGLLLYEIIVGWPVFPESDGPFVVIRRFRTRDFPAIPAKYGSLMQLLISRCWSMNPDDRPSFPRILALFQLHNFSLLPNADVTEIRDYCEAILEWERKMGIPQ
jgi:hypothetical protein